MKKLTITGNIGQDAQVLTNEQGQSYAKFSVAVTVGTKQNPKIDWVQVTCNDKLVELAKNYIKKGCKVLVEGFPEASAYIKDGVAVPTLKLYARTIELFTWAEQNVDENDVVAEADTTPETTY